MSWIGRFANLFRRNQLDNELDEELASHWEEALERGRSAHDVRRAFGPALRHREQSRDIKLLPWLDALASDVVFGWRQLNKHRAVSAAAILSLALAIGATTAAFRLVDSVMLRKLPVAEPERLFYLATTYIDREGKPDYRDDFDYPTFRRQQSMLANHADVILAGNISRQDVMFGSSTEPEKVYRQHVSGNLFVIFGLQPVLGRLLAPSDDVKPGGHPVAVLSYDCWSRRFDRSPAILGTTFRMGSDRYEIIGVAPKGFVGTEPGVVTDVFVPAMMNAQALNSPGWSWFRTWVRPRYGVSAEAVRQVLQAAFTREHEERLQNFHSDTPRQIIDAYMREKILLRPAASGASGIQKEYRRPLFILAALVILVLLVACVNVSNLLTARAAARAREMALRVSIGAGQWRLIQLVLVESALLATLASALGAVFAAWSAPLVVAMLHVPEDPVRLSLDTGWRELGFGVALTIAVTLLFGLAPALRASAVKPMSALKGGEDPHSRRRLMKTLLAAQMAFCVLVQFVAGLFVATFDRLSHRPLGFSYEHVAVMDVLDPARKRPLQDWMQVADRITQTPGVESASLAGWPLLSENRWTATVLVPGREPQVRPPYLLDVSPGFFETMRIARLAGRDFRPGDMPVRLTGQNQPAAGVGIVNEAFARVYLDGRNPVGRSVEVRQGKDVSVPMEIIGYVRDAAYGNLREPMHPTVYLPMTERRNNTLLVRTAGDPRALAPALRKVISQTDVRVKTIQAQSQFVLWHLLRERLLATLSLFFAIVALVLAAFGLFGVMNYSVTQQRREIGIRMALGARSAQVVRRITLPMTGVVLIGCAAGLVGGLASGRFIETLLFEVKPTDAVIVTGPVVALLIAALAAALGPALRAVHIDPAKTLRSE